MLLTQNRSGLIGFLLSLVQLAGHATWLALAYSAMLSGRAKMLTTSDAFAWAIVLIMGASMLLTLIAVFVCLFFGLRREPRALAVFGLMISFFTGVFATFIVLLG